MRLAGEEKLLLQQSGSDLAGFAISQDGSADLAFGSVLLSGGIAIQGVECFHSWSDSHSVQGVEERVSLLLVCVHRGSGENELHGCVGFCERARFQLRS